MEGTAHYSYSDGADWVGYCCKLSLPTGKPFCSANKEGYNYKRVSGPSLWQEHMAGHPMFVPRGARKRLLALSELIRLQLKAEEDKAKTVMEVREGVGEEEKAVVGESTSSLLVEIVLFWPTYGRPSIVRSRTHNLFDERRQLASDAFGGEQVKGAFDVLGRVKKGYFFRARTPSV